MSEYRFSEFRLASPQETNLFRRMTKVEMRCGDTVCAGSAIRNIGKVDRFECIDRHWTSRSFRCELNQPKHKNSRKLFFAEVDKDYILGNGFVKEVRFLDKEEDGQVEAIAILLASGKIYISEFVRIEVKSCVLHFDHEEADTS